MYRQPPSFATATVALVVGNATVNVIAAPGAGQILRLVGGQIGINRQVGAAVVDVLVTDGPGNVLASLRGLSLAGVPSGILDIPEPGILLPNTNSSIILSTFSTVAAGSGYCVLYYFQDFKD